MDSRTRLDYALFQLTPTRTRCDLVIFAGNNSEKLASGLLEPFLTHLRSAKDQISKGGYSINLQPSLVNASWFTKATLERFVKFVSTPEILERFVTTEREITQIESSVQSNEPANGTITSEGHSYDGDSNSAGFPKSNGESDGSDNAAQEENPKVRLQRVLESRKAVLRKEQAMAYARALVSGFDLDNLDDLISFANAFGALRLREACIKFIELCNKKRDDGIWMDEVAALQACSPEFSYLGRSGINFAAEHSDVTQDIGLTSRKQNGSIDASTSDTISHGSFDTNQDNGLSQMQSTDGKSQPMWPNNPSPYVQNFQNPAFQQIPPYPGYMYSGMQVAPNYYPGMPWPVNSEDSSRGPGPESDYNWKNKPPSKNKKKYSNGNDRNESNNSSSNSDSDDYGEDLRTKKHGKKSSRKVVIRNINYIAPKRNGRSDSSSEDSSDGDDGSIDAGSLKQQVKEAVGSLERHHNSTSRKKKNHGRKRNSSSNISNGASKEDIKGGVAREENTSQNWDFFQNILLQDADSRSNEMGSKTIQEEKSLRPVIRRESAEEELLFSQRTPEPEGYPQSILSNGATERVVLKGQKEEDWFVGDLPNKSAYQGEISDRSIFAGDYASKSCDYHLEAGKDKNGVLFYDSIMVQAPTADTVSDYHQQADIFMVSDMVSAEQHKNSIPNHVEETRPSNVCEPNDLFMVLGKDSAAEQVSASWNPEMDYENDVLLTETLKKHAHYGGSVDTKKSEGTNKKTDKDLGRKAVSKEPKSRAPVGSLGRTKSEISSRIKKSPSVSRTISLKSKAEKDEESRKRLEESLKQRQRRIAERSGTPGLTTSTSKRNARESVTPSKVEKPKPQAPTEATNRLHKPVFKSSTIDRLASTKTVKDRSTDPKATLSRKASQKENKVTAPLKKSAGNESKQGPRKVNHSDSGTHPVKRSDAKAHAKGNSASDSQKEKDVKDEIVDANNTEDMYSVSLSEKKDTPMLSAEHLVDEKKQSSQSAVPHNSKETKVVKFVLSEVESPAATDNAIGVSPQVTGNLSSGDLNVEPPAGQEILSNVVSTPPPNNEMNLETNHERKKWMTDESSLKVTKGFRKLLLFGRKS